MDLLGRATSSGTLAKSYQWHALVMMQGKKVLEEAGKLYSKAAKLAPRGAMDKLDVESARAERE
jgi:hypothetical protein